MHENAFEIAIWKISRPYCLDPNMFIIQYNRV